MRNISGRTLNFIGFGICLGLVLFALYLQYIVHVQPCPLCIIERLLFILMGMVLLIGAIHNPGERGIKIYGIVTIIIAIVGMLAAGRHLWLQSQPVSLGQICVPGFSYLFANLPVSQALKTFILGSADCAKVTWTFLGLSIPAWTFLFFDIYALLGLTQLTGFWKKQITTPIMQ